MYYIEEISELISGEFLYLREQKKQECGENYIINYFVDFLLLHLLWLGRPLQSNSLLPGFEI
jgi:hypothetical protein